MGLQYKVFFSKHNSATRTGPAGHDHLKRVPTSSTLIYGDQDAVLVDARLTTQASNELLDWVFESGKNITHIYVTHAHGDHFFGSAPILDRFPKATLVATVEVVARMKLETAPERMTGLWDKLFPGQIPPDLRLVEPLQQDYFELEGERLEVIRTGHTDTDETTTLWVPSIQLAVTGDAVYANTHPYLGESGTDVKRREWIKALDTITALQPKLEGSQKQEGSYTLYSLLLGQVKKRSCALQPKHVVGGHSDPSLQFGLKAIEDTKTYLENFEKLSAETKTAEELYARMMDIYPDRLNPGSLWAGAILVHQS